MLEIKLDVNDFLDELYYLSELNLNALEAQLTNNITNEIYKNWIRVAETNLNSTRAGYISGLNLQIVSPTEQDIVLVGWLNNSVENGLAPFNMKPSALNGANVKVSKSGSRYVRISFNMAVKGSKLDETQTYSRIIPKSVWQAFTQGKPIPRPHNRRNVRPGISNVETKETFPAYKHKQSLYAGLKQVGAKLSTIRTISDNSNPNSWIHKGIIAYNLRDKALAATDIDKITNDTIRKFLK